MTAQSHTGSAQEAGVILARGIKDALAGQSGGLG